MLHLMTTESPRIMQPNPDGTLSEPLKQAIEILQKSSDLQPQHMLHHSRMHQSNVSDLDTGQMEQMLMSGRRQGAVELAEGAGHWGLALMIARSMGEQHWGEAVNRFACQFDQESPLRAFMQVLIAAALRLFVMFGLQGVCWGSSRPSRRELTNTMAGDTRYDSR